jgi:hypothetical protein
MQREAYLDVYCDPYRSSKEFTVNSQFMFFRLTVRCTPRMAQRISVSCYALKPQKKVEGRIFQDSETNEDENLGRSFT